jgi:hypothetical protein
MAVDRQLTVIPNAYSNLMEESLPLKIIFFNTSYMKYYRGKQNDSLIGSFRFVAENNDGMEKYNFQPTIVNGQEIVLGFVEAGYSKGGFEKGKQRRIHIERIIDSETPVEMLRNNLIIWCVYYN